jgi:hypothetical protein
VLDQTKAVLTRREAQEADHVSFSESVASQSTELFWNRVKPKRELGTLHAAV